MAASFQLSPLFADSSLGLRVYSFRKNIYCFYNPRRGLANLGSFWYSGMYEVCLLPEFHEPPLALLEGMLHFGWNLHTHTYLYMHAYTCVSFNRIYISALMFLKNPIYNFWHLDFHSTLFLFIILRVWIFCLPTCLSTICVPGDHGDQKKAPQPLILEL